jgi:hypothetical protein
MFQQFEGCTHVSDEREPNPYLEQIREQIRSQGIRPARSVRELAGNGFESDEELDDFLDQLYIWRHSPENFG